MATIFGDMGATEEEPRVGDRLRGEINQAIDRMVGSALANLTIQFQDELARCKEDLSQYATSFEAICASLEEGATFTPELSALMSVTFAAYFDSAEARIKAFGIGPELDAIDFKMLADFDVIQQEIGISDLTMETILEVLADSIPVLPGFEGTL